jgi:hypothetical protein
MKGKIMRKVYITREDNIDEVSDDLYSYEYEFDQAVIKNPNGENIKTESFEYLMDILTFYYNQLIDLYTKEY